MPAYEATESKLRKKNLEDRYSPNDNPATLEESLINTKEEGDLLKQALSGKLTNEWQERLSEKWPGFNTTGVQEEIIKSATQVVYPNNNITRDIKLRFEWEAVEHIKLSEICLAFNLRILKNENDNTYFNMTAGHADEALMKKFCVREDFMFYWIKGIKLFTNLAKNQEHCSNNFVPSEFLSRMKALTYKKNYKKMYREKNLDQQMGSVSFGDPREFYSKHPTLDESTAVGGNIQAITGDAPNYQAILANRYNKKACGLNGLNFLIPLKLFNEIFEIEDYIGRKKFPLEIYFENKYDKLLEYIFPISEAQIASLSNVGFKMEDPRLFMQNHKINPTLVVEKTSLMMANPDKPYTLFRMQHLETIDNVVNNRNEFTIDMGNNKVSNWLGNTIIISCYRKDQLEHQNKNCMTLRDVSTAIVSQVSFSNCRRSYDSNPGDVIQFDMKDFLTRCQVYRMYASWHNGGLSSTSNIDNFVSAYHDQNDTFITNVSDYYDVSINYDQPLVFDMTSDYNSVQNAPPQIMTGSSAFQITIKFKENFTGQVTVGVYVPTEYIQNGTGLHEEITYSPNSLKAS